MGIINLRLNFVGYCIPEMNLNRLYKWKSKIFQIVDLQEYNLHSEADLWGWGYSDALLEKVLPLHKEPNAKIDVYILNVPLEQNHFSRILSENRIAITFYQVKEYLDCNFIPLENFLISLLYSYSLIYEIKLGDNMTMADEAWLAHSECRCCIFDMCGIKSEIVKSCVSPIICDKCKDKLQEGRNHRSDIKVSLTTINLYEKELKKLKRYGLSRLRYFLNNNLCFSLILSFCFAVCSSLFATFIWKCGANFYHVFF